MSRIVTITAESGMTTWNRVITPEFTEVSAVVAMAVSAPGSVNASTYRAKVRNMISIMRSIPIVALDAVLREKLGTCRNLEALKAPLRSVCVALWIATATAATNWRTVVLTLP